MIEALENFFSFTSKTKIDGILTTTIIQLIRLILENQFSVYENKLYQQMIGSSIDSSLIRILIDIYIFYWQYDLLRILNKKRDIFFRRVFGRHLNQIFFLWNGSKDELFTFLNTKSLTHSKYDHIRMTVSMDYKIQYLDAEICDVGRILQTRVYHHLSFEPYALPYMPEIQTRPSQSQILLLLRNSVIRAILYCSNEQEFENELLYIELSFLHNEISSYLIQKIIENFFIEFHVVKKDTCLFDENTYQVLQSSIRQNYKQKSKYHLVKRQWRY
ncbi:unnamed protein product [Rotaria sp. Silwood2]|nr:unnamed protein product [Rotaria sp. Silwood2]